MRRAYLDMVEEALNIGIELNNSGRTASEGEFTCTEEEYRVMCMASLDDITIERSQISGAPERFCGLRIVRTAFNGEASR